MTDHEVNTTVAGIVAAQLRGDTEGAGMLICDLGNTDPTDLAVLCFKLAELVTRRVRRDAAEAGLDDPDELLALVQQLVLTYTQEGTDA